MSKEDDETVAALYYVAYDQELLDALVDSLASHGARQHELELLLKRAWLRAGTKDEDTFRMDAIEVALRRVGDEWAAIG